MEYEPRYSIHDPEDLDSKVLADAGAALSGIMVSLGARIGLLGALAREGAATSRELAVKARIPESCVRAILSDMSWAGYVLYDPSSSRFRLPDRTPFPLQESQVDFSPGDLREMVIGLVSALEPLTDPGQWEKNLGAPLVADETWAAICRFTNARFEHLLTRRWIPALPALEASLRDGASVADIECGSGRVVLRLARDFPASRFTGFTSSAAAVQRASAMARASGLDRNVTFQRRAAGKDVQGAFDIVTLFDVLRDQPDPIGMMASIRGALARNGICLCLDVDSPGRLPARFGPFGALFQGFLLLYLVTARGPASREEASLRRLGAVNVEELCALAGFTQVRMVCQEGPMARLYEIAV